MNIYTVACVVLFLLLALISGETTLYGDDFLYGTYFLGGLKNFFEMSIEHYMQMNGRSFVHFCLEIVLIFKDRLFCIVIPAMVAAVFVLLGKILKQEQGTVDFSKYSAYCIMGTMCLSPDVLREGMLWMSGAFNYIFPVIFSLSGFYFLLKIYSGEKIKPVYLLTAFLCGATTEQCAVMGICQYVLFTFFEYVHKKNFEKRSLPFFFCMILGFLTLIASPGTVSRIDTETSNALLGITDRLDMLYTLALDKSGTAPVFLLFQAMLTVTVGKKNKKLLFIGFLILSVELVLCFFELYLLCGVLLTVALMYFAFFIMIRHKKHICGVLMLSSLLSIGMLVMSTSFGARNLMPSLLILIGVESYWMSFAIKERHCKPIFLTAMLLSMIVFYPTLHGYIKNREIINENINSLSRKDGEIYYNVDINSKYAYNQFYVDSFYYEGIKKIYGVAPEEKIFITGKDFAQMYCNGVHCESPIYVKDGTEYYPMRGVTEAFGGSVEWNDEAKETIISLNGREIKFDGSFFYDGERMLGSDDYRLVDFKYGNMFMSNVYLNKEAYSHIFKIDL